MQILKQTRQYTAEDGWTLGIVTVAVLYVVACDYALAVGTVLPAICPWRMLEIHCPGCGMTRASGHLLHGDVLAAVRDNPLVLLISPYVIYRVAESVTSALTGRALVSGWPAWVGQGYQAAFLISYGLLATIRILSWLTPACNPLRIGLPIA